MAKPTKALALTKSEKSKFSDLELEVMKRLLEREPAESIQKALGLDQSTYDAMVQRPLFGLKFDALAKDADQKALPKRLENLAGEALDVVRDIMRNATHPAYRLQAALQILDRSGHVKIEKRLQINADAETIIKHLNQQGITQPATLDITPTSPIEDAVIVTQEIVSSDTKDN